MPEYCLEIPTPYLIQHFGRDTILNHQDEAGYSILHWAVGKASLSKIKELLSEGFSMNCSSKTGDIPENLTHLYEINPQSKVYASPLGITPLQLAIYLHQQLSYRFSLGGKGTHWVEKNMQAFKDICTYFQIEDYSYTNKMGQSATDLVFLTENLGLIEHVQQIDNDFSSLHSVNITTAHKILHNHWEFRTSGDAVSNKWEFDLIEQMKNILLTREEKEKLDQKLCLKDNAPITTKRGKI